MIPSSKRCGWSHGIASAFAAGCVLALGSGAGSRVEAGPPPASESVPPPAVPGGRFALVIDEDCSAGTRVEDLETRTLVISPGRARFLEPGQRWQDAADAGRGLPSPRGISRVFATSPPMLRVDLRARAGPETHAPYRHFRFEDGAWIEVREDFGEDPVALRVPSGSVIAGWIEDPEHGDPGGVPIGNLVRAWHVSPDGSTSVLRAWPRVMTWQERATPAAIWAIAALPRRPGLYLLRIPEGRAAALHLIPGTGACRRDDRLSQLAVLTEAGDDDAQVILDEGRHCVPPRAPGVYRFAVSGARWRRVAALPPYEDRGSWPADDRVTVGGATFRLDGDAVVVTQAGASARLPLEERERALRGERSADRLFTTANGREVWVATSAKPRCQIRRFESAQPRP